MYKYHITKTQQVKELLLRCKHTYGASISTTGSSAIFHPRLHSPLVSTPGALFSWPKIEHLGGALHFKIIVAGTNLTTLGHNGLHIDLALYFPKR
jgi:hypothetical protein